MGLWTQICWHKSAPVQPALVNPSSSIGTMHAAAAAILLCVAAAAQQAPRRHLRYPEPSVTHGQHARTPCSLLSRKRVTRTATVPKEPHDPVRTASRTRGAMMHLAVWFPLGCNQTDHNQAMLQGQHQVESSSQQQEHGKPRNHMYVQKNKNINYGASREQR